MVQLYLYPQAEYINWGKGQPNNKGDGGQDCVGIGSKIVKGGKFNDEDCNAPGKFICEKHAKGSIKAEQKCGYSLKNLNLLLLVISIETKCNYKRVLIC